MKSVKVLSSRAVLPPCSPCIRPCNFPIYRSLHFLLSPILLQILYFHLRLIFCLFSPFHSSLILSGIFPFTFCCNERGFRFILILFSVSISLLFLFIFPYPPILYFSSSLFFHMFSSSKKNCPSFF